jgi:hypothetical protein
MCGWHTSRLFRLPDLAQELGAEPQSQDARELAARVAEGRVYVACVASSSEANPRNSTLSWATKLSRPTLFRSRQCQP